MRNVDIFLASPGDVAAERGFVQEVIEAFNNRVADNFRVRLKLLKWESATPDLGDPQDLINAKAEAADLVIVIMRRRFGQATRDFASGTLEEFALAYQRWKARKRPRVWVYFGELTDKERDDPGQQLRRVLDFRRWFEEERIGLYSQYTSPEEFRYRFQMDLFESIIQSVLPSLADDDRLGILGTISGITNQGIDTLSGLSRFTASGEQPFEGAVVINRRSDPVSVYRGGLSIVKKRFWTTAFLDSVYWDGRDAGVLTANQSMLERIQNVRGTARRLLMASLPPAQEAQWMASFINYLEISGREEEAAERRRQFDYLREAMDDLCSRGFDTRVGCDTAKAYKNLPLRFDADQFDPRKFGLTLYDDVRLDIFQEGKFGVAGSVACITQATQNFEVLRGHAETYFNRLWATAMPFAEFIAEVDKNVRK